MAKEHTFISYCRDNRNEVYSLCVDLESSGEQVWWDQDILPGQNWRFEIRKAMKRSYAVVFCFSKETEGRLKSGIYPELRDAIAIYREYALGSLFLIPIRLSSCKLPDIEIDTTSTLSSINYIDLFPTSQWTGNLHRLIQALKSAPEHP